jgi:lauroyl/myristoyl acyltransferase
MGERWKKIRHQLEYAGVAALAWFIPRLSRRACVRLARALGSLAFRFDARGRAVALENIALAFGDRFSPAERERIARESYRNFSLTMLSLFWSARLNAGNWTRFIHLENEAQMIERRKSQPGALFLITHHGNFEWTHVGVGFSGNAGWGVAETFKNPLLTEIFQRLRAAGGHRVVEQEHSVLKFFKQLKLGAAAGLLIDLTLRPDQPSAVIDAFGRKMCVTIMHAVLHQRAGVPLYPLESVPLEDGSVRVIVHEPLFFPKNAAPHEIAQACWDFYEPRIRERPELWMWSYKHWRYRPKDAPEPYPGYANESKKFEKLLRAQEGK